MNQIFNIFGCGYGPVDVATNPVKGQGLVSTELTGKLQERDAKSAPTIKDVQMMPNQQLETKPRELPQTGQYRNKTPTFVVKLW